VSSEQRPQLLGMPEHGGKSAEPDSAVLAAKTESFFSSLIDPHSGHFT